MPRRANTANLADQILEETALDAVEETALDAVEETVLDSEAEDTQVETEPEVVKEPEHKRRTAKKKETVVIHLPLTKELKEPLWVSVNGKTYQIKRGVDVEVPVGVAKVIRRSERAELAIMEYDEKMAASENL